DHLDRYPGLAQYAAAKMRLIQAIRPDGVAVIGVDAAWGRAATAPEGVRRVTISNGQAADVSGAGGFLHTGPDGAALLDLREAAALPGAHNWQNAAAAFAACRAAGVAKELILGGMLSFPGLRHRQQPGDTVAGIAFVNDSK